MDGSLVDGSIVDGSVVDGSTVEGSTVIGSAPSTEMSPEKNKLDSATRDKVASIVEDRYDWNSVEILSSVTICSTASLKFPPGAEPEIPKASVTITVGTCKLLLVPPSSIKTRRVPASTLTTSVERSEGATPSLDKTSS